MSREELLSTTVALKLMRRGSCDVMCPYHTREFSCGRLYYRTFYLDPRQDALYVGAMDNVFKLNLKDINRTDCELYTDVFAQKQHRTPFGVIF
ncbi:semaphorin [Tyrophagus putrescentiae]|nr:semaphorin [Tyrophagus putrescentiae]